MDRASHPSMGGGESYGRVCKGPIGNAQPHLIFVSGTKNRLKTLGIANKVYGRPMEKAQRAHGSLVLYLHIFISLFLFLLSGLWESVHRGPMGKAQWPPWNNQRLVITAEYLLLMTQLLSPGAANACHAFTKIEKPGGLT